MVIVEYYVKSALMVVMIVAISGDWKHVAAVVAMTTMIVVKAVPTVVVVMVVID